MEKGLISDPIWATLRVRDGRAECPICGRLTGQRILDETVLVNFPLFCKHCRRDAIVNTEEPEPEPQSQSQSRS